ncbi:MAG TPA: hypothetical protein VN660_13775 [Steroidobacteraceae bacterium]|nr:hypothetical protein [Steroidobacteraceae bacterium]
MNMPISNDAYWDELGIAWRATNPDLNVITPKLMTRLRWQRIVMLGMMAAGIALSIAGLILGIYTLVAAFSAHIWNFVTRGLAIIVISLLFALASWSVREGLRTHTRSLMEMIDASISRAEGLSRAVQMGYWVCAVAAVFGLVGEAIRARLYHPAAMSPIGSLILLAVSCAALFFYHRHVRSDLARFRYLRGALRSDDRATA